MKESTEIVTPGTPLGYKTEFQLGEGTYIRDEFVYASLIGEKRIVKGEDGELPTISVIGTQLPPIIPDVGSVVIGQVSRINSKQATVNIMVVNDKPCKDNFIGVIRVQDVRATEIDKVQINKNFRPGDIVKAQVISLGDSKSYYLSTAKNELGVIMAQSIAGETMIPISWIEMQCPKTLVIENRKCAKPSFD